MHQALPPLPWLRAFEVSARHLSFTAAAQEMNLSQAAISKQIKLLEQQLREPLFVRLPRALALTKTGEAFLPKVRDAFERLSAGTQEVFGQRGSDTLTVRAAVGFAVNWLGPRLPDFIQRHPNVPLRVISSVWNEAADDGACDLDIRYGSGDWPGEISERLTSERILPVCAPALIGQLQRVDALREQRLIHVLGYREGWALWLKAAGAIFVNDHAGLQVDTSLLAFEIAAQGAGVALARTSMIGRELEAGRLVAPFALSVPVDEGFYLTFSRAAQNAKHASIFADWILHAAQVSRL